jgi:hypothetical protein
MAVGGAPVEPATGTPHRFAHQRVEFVEVAEVGENTVPSAATDRPAPVYAASPAAGGSPVSLRISLVLNQQDLAARRAGPQPRSIANIVVGAVRTRGGRVGAPRSDYHPRREDFVPAVGHDSEPADRDRRVGGSERALRGGALACPCRTDRASAAAK